MTGGPFAELERGAYRVILADPPWRFVTRSAKGLGKSPERHYSTMTLEEIRALPVAELAHKDGAVLVMWSTSPHLEAAMGVLRAWGFTYATVGSWAKRSRAGRSWQFGGGYFMRSACEPFLIGTRGRPGLPLVRDVRNLIVAPVREHSRKPDEMHAALERMYAGPRLELFARESRSGWQTWGSEKEKFDDERVQHTSGGACAA